MLEELLKLEDLVNNPTARIPVCLCLDTSGSMDGKPIKELNDGIKLFYEAIEEDEIAKYSAEVSIVKFGGDAKCIEGFSSLENRQIGGSLNAIGGTPMGEGVNIALDLLEERKKEYSENGVDYYQPWLVLMTDGQPNGLRKELERAIERVNKLVDDGKLTVFPIAIGENADIKVLERFSKNRKPLKLQGLRFKEFFAWLSKSVSNTSKSMVGDKIKLDIEGLKGWAEL
ncbi:VWA domain-containing protein [uncultured Clostridium sp.]|uniref:vWA domain-containing protein n=1 Tax=uncultured Clostridium sp. TaxID=59620 RepID=UPI00260FF4E5|nr:VWA domain-containing protein [uncultured Clostridium sp.]